MTTLSLFTFQLLPPNHDAEPAVKALTQMTLGSIIGGLLLYIKAMHKRERLLVAQQRERERAEEARHRDEAKATLETERARTNSMMTLVEKTITVMVDTTAVSRSREESSDRLARIVAGRRQIT